MAYVTNEDFKMHLLASHRAGKLTIPAYKAFNDIVDMRINKMLVHNKNQHKDAMKVKCMTKIELIWQKYKFDRDNAFAYFVSIIDNVIKRYFIDNQIEMLSINHQYTK